MNDADIETHELNQLAHQIATLRRKGICCHNGSRPVTPGKPHVACTECGKFFASFEALDEERREILI